MRSGFIKDKAFYKTMLAIALPIALQNVISFGVQMMDTVMVGSLGDVALSASSLANQPFFVFTILCFGLGSGGAVLIAQYWGRGNTDAIRRVLSISMRCVIVVAVVFTVLCSIFPYEIMCLFSKETEVIDAAVGYLRIVCASYVFFGFANCYMTSLRATENVGISTKIYIVSFLVNVFFNYVFIFGKLGAPAMGLEGAAVGTVIARFTEFLMTAGYTTFFEKHIAFRLKWLLHNERELLRDYFKHSGPVVGSELVWSLSTVAQAAIIGHIGKEFVAAHSIMSVVQQLGMVMMFGIGSAAAVLMGKAAGQNRMEEARRMGNTLIALAAGVGVLACGLVLVLRGPMLLLYDVSPETKALAYDIMGVLSVLMLFSAIELVSITGILRGAGDARFAFKVDVGCGWLIAVPMGILAGFVWRLPVVWVYVCMRCDLVVRVILCLNRIIRGKYIKNVTRDV